MKQQENMFTSALEQRKKEQQRIEETVMSGPSEPEVKLRKRGDKATTITLTISAEDKVRVKSYAAQHSTTVSDMLHQWIERDCTE